MLMTFDVPTRGIENQNNRKEIPTLLGGNIGTKRANCGAVNGAGALLFVDGAVLK
jgi:hypothetical protein